MMHRILRWLIIGLLVILVTGCSGRSSTFAPPWTLYDSNASYDRSSSAVDKGHVATVNATAGTGYLYLRMDTHTTNVESRSGRTEGAFLLGGTFTAPVSGVYEFVFVYDYSGEGKVQYGGSYRYAAVAGVTAAVGDVQSTTVPLYVCASTGDELDVALEAIEGVGNIIGGVISGDISKIFKGVVDVLKSYKSETETEALNGTEQIVVSATLQAGEEYDFYVLTSGAVRAKASRYGNLAEANIKLEGKLRTVQIRRS